MNLHAMRVRAACEFERLLGRHAHHHRHRDTAADRVHDARGLLRLDAARALSLHDEAQPIRAAGQRPRRILAAREAADFDDGSSSHRAAAASVASVAAGSALVTNT